MGILVQNGGIVTKGNGIFDTSAGTDCCCGPQLYLKALPCSCDTLPPGAPSYLLISPDGLPNVNPFVFLDSVYQVCWTVNTAQPPVEPLPGDVFATTYIQQASCLACCGPPTCPTFAAAPASVTVNVNWTFNGVDPPNESPPANFLSWTMVKSLDSGGKAKYTVEPFDCHPTILCCTANGCSMRWIATLLCDSPQGPGLWRMAFTFESAPMTFGVCDSVPPACPGGVRFYGVSALKALPSPLGSYSIQSQTPDVTNVSVTVT